MMYKLSLINPSSHSCEPGGQYMPALYRVVLAYILQLAGRERLNIVYNYAVSKMPLPRYEKWLEGKENKL